MSERLSHPFEGKLSMSIRWDSLKSPESKSVLFDSNGAVPLLENVFEKLKFCDAIIDCSLKIHENSTNEKSYETLMMILYEFSSKYGLWLKNTKLIDCSAQKKKKLVFKKNLETNPSMPYMPPHNWIIIQW